MPHMACIQLQIRETSTHWLYTNFRLSLEASKTTIRVFTAVPQQKHNHYVNVNNLFTTQSNIGKAFKFELNLIK